MLQKDGRESKSIYLLAHNREAYKSAAEMLRKAGKAAVIHPTGTGKSFSGIQLCEDHPDYIILDEFHRCGAQKWGAGVNQRLSLYPDVPALGLSATNIRYLDNQRDMAQELFGGNIASEMSLGEAIVRGILNPPKYVLSTFSCQKGLEKYTLRVQSARSKVVRDQGEAYLEVLRRALEKQRVWTRFSISIWRTSLESTLFSAPALSICRR